MVQLLRAGHTITLAGELRDGLSREFWSKSSRILVEIMSKSFNGKLRDELLDREIFTTLDEAKVLIEQWRKEYNQVRPHSARNNRPPAPEAILTMTTT